MSAVCTKRVKPTPEPTPWHLVLQCIGKQIHLFLDSISETTRLRRLDRDTARVLTHVSLSLVLWHSVDDSKIPETPHLVRCSDPRCDTMLENVLAGTWIPKTLVLCSTTCARVPTALRVLKLRCIPTMPEISKCADLMQLTIHDKCSAGSILNPIEPLHHNKAMRKLTLWRLPSLRLLDDIVSPTCMAHATTVNIESCHRLALFQVGKRLVNLFLVDLPAVKTLDLKKAPTLRLVRIRNLDQLKTLSFSISHGHLLEVQVSTCSHLEKLKLPPSMGTLKCTDLPLVRADILDACVDGVTHLRLSKCPTVDVIQVGEMMQSLHLTEMRSLSVVNVPPDTGLEKIHIGGRSSLTQLYLHKPLNLDTVCLDQQDMLTTLTLPRVLKVLVVADCAILTNLQFLGFIPNLRSLRLDYVYHTGDDEAVVSDTTLLLPRLEKLDLHCVSNVSPKLLMRALTKYPTLTDIQCWCPTGKLQYKASSTVGR